MVKMGTVWDRTAEFLTDNLPAILPIALLAYFVPFSIMGSLAPILSDTHGAILVLWIIVLALAAVVNWGGLALVAMALEKGETPAKEATRRLVPALLVSVLLFFVTLLVALPPALAIGYTGSGVQQMQFTMPVTVMWALCIYCVLAVGLAFWLGARLVLVNAVIVAEERWFGAIARSWVLTRGIALSIVGVAILYVVVSFVGVLATKLVFGSIFGLVAGATEGLSLSNILTSVMVAAVEAGFTMVAPVFGAKLYQAVVAANAQHA